MNFDEEYFNDEKNNYYVDLKEKLKKYEALNVKKIETNKSPTYCSECKTDSAIEDYKNGLYICSKCGLSLMQLIDTKNIFTGDVETMQNYINVNKYIPELSCLTSIKGMSSSSIVKTLHKWYKVSYEQRALNEKYLLIQDICFRHKLKKCVEDTAKILYTQIYYEKYSGGKNPIFRGNNYLGLIAVCVWNSAMKYGINLYPKELAEMCNIKPIYIKKGEQIFNSLCKLKKFVMFKVEHSCVNYITRFCDILNIHVQYREIAIQMSKNIVKLKIFNSQQYISIAVGVIYTICMHYNLNLTKQQIANTFKISEGTILKTFKKFKPFIKILMNDDLTNKLALKITTFQNKILYHKNYVLQSIKFQCMPNMEILHFNSINDIYHFYVDVNLVLNLEYNKIFSFHFYSF